MNTTEVAYVTGADSSGHGAAGCRIRVTAWSLPRHNAPRRARDLLRSQLDGHVTDEAVLDDLDLVVCELATNAYQHTHGPCEMRLIHHEGVPVVCEIADTGGGLDEITQRLQGQPASAATDAGGRGLRIVAHLTGGHCGVQATRLCGTGQPAKSVWFAIPVDHTPS